VDWGPVLPPSSRALARVCASRSQRTFDLFEQHTKDRENHRHAEREPRVDGEKFHGHHFADAASIQSVDVL